MARINGQLEVAQLENLTADPALLPDGRVWIDTATDEQKFYDGTTVRTVVTTASTQTLTNKTLTSPAITTPTGLVKGDVGLGNVDNTSDATKNAAAVTLTNKTIDIDQQASVTNIANANIKAAAAIAVNKLAALTASRAVVSDASGFITAATTTATEIGYVNGVTSAIQTQLNAKAADSGVVHNTGNETVAGIKTFSDYLKRGATDSITAFATGGQASATALTKDFNRISTCASAGDSVKLPAATAGMEITVINDGAAILAVFPSSGESIDAGAANASSLLNPDASAKFVCLTAGVWQSLSLGGGGGETFQGSNTSPKAIVAANGITSSQISTTASRQVIYAEGSVAATLCDISANPQIAAHSVVGAYLEVIGTSSTAPIQFDNGTGLALKAASRILNAGSVLGLRWNESASVYQEVSWSE